MGCIERPSSPMAPAHSAIMVLRVGDGTDSGRAQNHPALPLHHPPDCLTQPLRTAGLGDTRCAPHLEGAISKSAIRREPSGDRHDRRGTRLTDEQFTRIPLARIHDVNDNRLTTRLSGDEALRQSKILYIGRPGTADECEHARVEIPNIGILRNNENPLVVHTVPVRSGMCSDSRVIQAGSDRPFVRVPRIGRGIAPGRLGAARDCERHSPRSRRVPNTPSLISSSAPPLASDGGRTTHTRSALPMTPDPCRECWGNVRLSPRRSPRASPGQLMVLANT